MISVITPLYNSYEFLGDFRLHLLSLNVFDKFEWIIIDDGSMDNFHDDLSADDTTNPKDGSMDNTKGIPLGSFDALQYSALGTFK